MLKLPPMLTYTPPPSLPFTSSVLFLVMEPPYMLKVPLATYTPPPSFAVFWVMAPPYMLKVALAPTYTAPPYRSELAVPPLPPVMLPLPAQSCRAREASVPALPLMMMLCPFKFIVCPLIRISIDVARHDVFPPASELTFPLSFVQPAWSPVQFPSAAAGRHRQQGQHHTHHKQQAKPLSSPCFSSPSFSLCNPPCFSENSRIFSARFPAAPPARGKAAFSLRPEARGAPDPSPGLSCGRRRLPYPLWKGPLTGAFIRCYLKKQQGPP